LTSLEIPPTVVGELLTDKRLTYVRCPPIDEWGAGAFAGAMDYTTGNHLTPTFAQWAPLLNSNSFDLINLALGAFNTIELFFKL